MLSALPKGRITQQDGRGWNFPVKCAARTTLLVLWCLFQEELFLAPFGYERLEWFVAGVVESSDVEKHYSCIMQFSSTIVGAEGKLSSWQEDPFESVMFPGHMVLPSAKWKESTCRERSKTWTHWQFFSLLWIVVFVWTWPLGSCIADATQAFFPASYTGSFKWGCSPQSLFFFGGNFKVQQYLTWIQQSKPGAESSLNLNCSSLGCKAQDIILFECITAMDKYEVLFWQSCAAPGLKWCSS